MEHDNKKIFKLGDMVFLIGFSWWINRDMDDMPIQRIKAEDVLILKGKVVAKDTLELEEGTTIKYNVAIESVHSSYTRTICKCMKPEDLFLSANDCAESMLNKLLKDEG